MKLRCPLVALSVSVIAAAVLGGIGGGRSAVAASAMSRAATASKVRPPSPSAPQINAGRRVVALDVARQMLCDLSLPAGSQRLAREPTDPVVPMSAPAAVIFLNASVTRTRFYRTGVAPATAIAAIRAGLPRTVRGEAAGLQLPGQGEVFVYPRIDRGRLGIRRLVVQASPTSDARGTVVRIDAEVQAIAERIPGQAIPQTARLVDVTRPRVTGLPGPGRGRHRLPAISLTVTAPAQVAALARDVDALPFIAPKLGVFACPAEPSAPTVTFTFRAAARDRPLATVRLSAATPTAIDPCLTGSLIVGGRSQPRLMEAGVLLEQGSALLGVDLTTPYLIGTRSPSAARGEGGHEPRRTVASTEPPSGATRMPLTVRRRGGRRQSTAR